MVAAAPFLAVAAAAQAKAVSEAKSVSVKPTTAKELRELLSPHFGVIYWSNPNSGLPHIIVHPDHQAAVKAMGIDPNHPLILWIDLDQWSAPPQPDTAGTVAPSGTASAALASAGNAAGTVAPSEIAPGAMASSEKAAGTMAASGTAAAGAMACSGTGAVSVAAAPMLYSRELIADPEVTEGKLDPDTRPFFVLACDGLYDVMSNDEVIKFIRPRLHASWASHLPDLPDRYRDPAARSRRAIPSSRAISTDLTGVCFSG
jgi:hypothetical protein